jgi:enamine deaminase RidA (YjgF/YER057c/UK114 family)
MKNIAAVVKAANTSMDDMIGCQVWLTDIT